MYRGVCGPPAALVGIWGHWGPLRKHHRNLLCHYVRNCDIFHLQPFPSKNIENFASLVKYSKNSIKKCLFLKFPQEERKKEKKNNFRRR